MYDANQREPAQGAREVRQELTGFLQPLLAQLDAQIDQRLVRTFVRTIDAILSFRNRPHGLLLSELGAYILDPAHAAAGTKRLSNLLRSKKWSASASETFLMDACDEPSGRIGTAGQGRPGALGRERP